MRWPRSLALCFLFSPPLPLSAQLQATFQGIGDLPGGPVSSSAGAVSGDGTTVVGASQSAMGWEAFRWRDGTMQPLGDLPGGNSFYSYAIGVSTDGTKIAGSSASGPTDQNEPFLWTPQSGMVGLGKVPGSTSCGVSGMSPDGSVIFGSCHSPGGNETFRYSSGQFMGLGDLPGAGLNSYAYAASSLGNVVVGWGQGFTPLNPSAQHAVRWDASGLVDLNVLPGIGELRVMYGTSPSGTAMVGMASVCRNGQCPGRAALVFADVAVLLDPYESDQSSEGRGVSANGSVVVGAAPFGAFIWDPITGTRELRTVLVDAGVTPSGWTLGRANSVSHNGTTIVGHGKNPSGFDEGWIVRLDDDDGVSGTADNCPLTANTDQQDSDGDLVGDACDACPSDPVKITPGACGCGQPEPDADDDGIPDCIDICPLVYNPPQLIADCDGNLIPDDCEKVDCNRNSLHDVCELLSGTVSDCDSNLVPDECQPDSDADLVINPCDQCPESFPGLPVDEVGCVVPEGGCCFGEAICIDQTTNAPCALVGGWFLGDGIACGSDPDHDGFVGCADGCPLDFNKQAPGHCGCGVADVDTDSDGVLDCDDACPGTSPDDSVNTCGCLTRGACCFPIGVCFESVWIDDCDAIGGRYQGDGVACSAECDAGDSDKSGFVDLIDFAVFQTCMGEIVESSESTCMGFDLDACGAITLSDFMLLYKLLDGP